MKLIFFGAGYCSKYILPRMSSETEIICTHNHNLTKEKFDEDLGIKRFIFSKFKEKDLLCDATHIINSIPPVNNQDIVYNYLNSIGFKSLKKLKWFGHLSSTSVYGNHNGKWVNEKTKLEPTSLRGKNRKHIEENYLRIHEEFNIPIHIFRLPGIYGPKRSVIEKLISGNKIFVSKEKHFFSRIHVEDIASAIIQSFNNVTPGEIFNVSDNFPCGSKEVSLFAAKLLKINDIVFKNVKSPEISTRVKEFYKDNKRVSNKKIKKRLDWTPKFENYKLGLENIFNNYYG